MCLGFYISENNCKEICLGRSFSRKLQNVKLTGWIDVKMPDKLLLYEGFRAWRVREGGLRRFFWKGKDLVLVMNHRVG